MKALIILFLAIHSIYLTSCQSILGSKGKEIRNTHTNKVDSQAKVITAQYGKTYNLAGNTTAKYPNFDIRLLSTEIKQNETISHFEIVSKSGFENDSISCSTAEPDKDHFSLEDMHFYYHSDAPGKINIYIPSLLIAFN